VVKGQTQISQGQRSIRWVQARPGMSSHGLLLGNHAHSTQLSTRELASTISIAAFSRVDTVMAHVAGLSL
jgi:hypothetical protein